MGRLDIAIIEDHPLYQVGRLELVGAHSDRRLAPNIDHGGNVHLNLHEPGGRSGNHYHERVEEFSINPGPGALLLHLRDMATGAAEVVEMQPIALDEMRAYRPKLGVPHLVENPCEHRSALIIVVDRDSPRDVVSAKVYDG